MNWNDLEENKETYLSKGIHLTKATDSILLTNTNGIYMIKIRFCNTNNAKHDETFFITALSIWKFQKLFKDIGLTTQEKADINIKSLQKPEDSAKEIADHIKKYVVGKYYKIELIQNKMNPKYNNLQQIRQLLENEITPAITNIKNLFADDEYQRSKFNPDDYPDQDDGPVPF